MAPQLLEEEKERVADRVQEARYECLLAKHDLETFVQTMRTHPLGITATDGILMVHLAVREQNALLKFAQALQAFYDHNKRLERFN